jgi:uncharacterized membrane protein YoaK (UPF0700 family)
MKKRDVLLGAVLCFAGGAIDGYSYVMRGGVLATAQTANLLLLGLNISDGNWAKALNYIIPILCFMVGTYLAKMAYEKVFHKKTIKWQEGVVLTEVAVFLVLGFMDDGVSNLLANAMISFFSAMQYCAFRSFGDNAPYATVFSTGNMRSLIDNVYEGTMHKDRTSRKRAVGYVIMLLAFAMGAAGSNLLSKVIAYQACWLVCVALFAAFVLMRVLKEHE